jgi:hypothetical protein
MGGRADSPPGPHGLSSTHKKSLREIADFKESKFAPGGPANASIDSVHFWLYSPQHQKGYYDAKMFCNSAFRQRCI